VKNILRERAFNTEIPVRELHKILIILLFSLCFVFGTPRAKNEGK